MTLYNLVVEGLSEEVTFRRDLKDGKEPVRNSIEARGTACAKLLTWVPAQWV